MGRNKLNPARKYFEFNKEGNKNTCKVCNITMSGDHGANLERHLRRYHQKEFQDVRQSKMKKFLSQFSIRTFSGKRIIVPKTSSGLSSFPEFSQVTSECDALEIEIEESSVNQSPSSDIAIPDSKRKRESSTPLQKELLNSSVLLPGECEEEVIAKVWSFKLKRMKYDQRLFAEKFISDILLEGELGTLHRNSVKINEDHNIDFVTQSDSSITRYGADEKLVLVPSSDQSPKNMEEERYLPTSMP